MTVREGPPKAPSSAGELAWLVATAGLHGSVGAWVGFGVDHLVRREEELYRRPSDWRLTVAPTLSADRRGVAVSLTF